MSSHTEIPVLETMKQVFRTELRHLVVTRTSAIKPEDRHRLLAARIVDGVRSNGPFVKQLAQAALDDMRYLSFGAMNFCRRQRHA